MDFLVSKIQTLRNCVSILILVFTIFSVNRMAVQNPRFSSRSSHNCHDSSNVF